MFKAMEGRSTCLGSLPRFKISRRCWPSFLSSMVTASHWRSLARRDPRRPDARTRWSPKYIALTWIIMAWSIRPGAVSRFEDARDVLARIYRRRHRPGETYQGLVKASSTWAAVALRELWLHLRPTLTCRMTKAAPWYGWTILAVDGSRFDAPRTRSNERALGLSGRKKTHPQWNATMLIHLPTGLLWNWRQGSANDSERGHLREMLDDLPANSLLVGDAGFTGFDLMYEMHGRGVTFLIRCGANVTLLVDGACQRIESHCGQKHVYLWPAKEHGRLPLCLRLIILKRRKRRIHLLTNELDSTRLSRAMAAELYRARWGVEIGYRELKQTLDRRKLSSRSPDVGANELAAVMLAWALLRLQSCILIGPRLLRLSMAAALGVMQRTLESVRHAEPTAWFFDAIGECLRDQYQRHRSKRARDWPHKKKEPPPSPPKLRRMTHDHFTRIQQLLVHEIAA